MIDIIKNNHFPQTEIIDKRETERKVNKFVITAAVCAGYGEEMSIPGLIDKNVHELFRDFKYNPIDDARFAVFEDTADALTEEEKNVSFSRRIVS